MIRRRACRTPSSPMPPTGSSTWMRCRPRRRAGRASTAWTWFRPSAQRHVTTGMDQLDAREGLRQAAQDALFRHRRRLRHQAQHPAPARRLRLRGDRRAGDRDRRGNSRAQARRRFPVERPGRSGRDRRLCRADDPGAARNQDPALRHLPRPPAARARGRRAHAKMPRAITAPTIR